jgi:hypothetical protein
MNGFPRIAPVGTPLSTLFPSIELRVQAVRPPDFWEKCRVTRPGNPYAPLTVEERLGLIEASNALALDAFTDLLVHCLALTGFN